MRRERRVRGPAAAALTGIAALALVALEDARPFAPIRDVLRRQSIEPAVLRRDALGSALKAHGLLIGTPPGDQLGSPDAWSLRANPGGIAAFPSSLAWSELAADHAEARRGLVVSVTADRRSLHGSRGLLSHPHERGADWERPAFVSVYEDGRPRLASAVGMRLHGRYEDAPARARRVGSLRLYLRDEYGLPAIPPGALFAPDRARVQTLVLRPEPLGFTNMMGLEIARRLGAAVPDFRPARMLVNGAPLRPIGVFKHLSRRQWREELGHDDFLFAPYRGDADAESAAAYAELRAWAGDTSAPMTLEAARQRLDVEQLTAHLLAIAFCGTTDWEQGAAVLDRREARPRWRWIAWDMDHSFGDHAGSAPEGESWRKPSFELLTTSYRAPRDPPPLSKWTLRSILFVRLVRESPEYRDLLGRAVVEMLNHRLTPAYLSSLLERYAEYTEIEHWQRSFAQMRPALFREAARRLLDLPEPVRIRVEAPSGLRPVVDGFEHEAGFEGWYFPGWRLTVEVAADQRNAVSHWLVDGRRVEGKRLEHAVTGPATIVAAGAPGS